MPETSTHTGHSTDDDTAICLEHVTVENEDAPDACTMYPRECSESEMATHWITALEGSYVALEDVR
ncbi:DUF7511 domain-containing protein [Natrialbaceae archaeon A-gly3]